MPHRVIFLWAHVKLVGGVVGMATAAIAYLPFAVADPDHLKLLILAVGGAFLTLTYFAMKELIPLYVSARKQLKQMAIDLVAMDEKVKVTESAVTSNAEAIGEVRDHAERIKREANEEAGRIKREALAQAARIEKEAAAKRHDLADRLQAALAAREVELLEANERIRRLEARVGVTNTAVNTVADSVQEIADRMDPPIPVDIPHLDPESNRR